MRLLYFRADWCAPCSQQGEIIDDLDTSIEVEKIDVGTDTGQDRAAENNVRSLPTMLLREDGETIAQFSGLTDADTLTDAIEEATG